MTHKNLTLQSIVRFTGMSQDYIARQVADSIYQNRFPTNFARELIHNIWEKKGLPDMDRPRLMFWDIEGAFKRGRSTVRKDVGRHLPDSRSRDITGRRVFSLNEFFKLAKVLGRDEWTVDESKDKKPRD